MAIFVYCRETQSDSTYEAMLLARQESAPAPRDGSSRRYLIGLIVVLLHAGLIIAILLARPPPSRELIRRSSSLSLLRLPNDSTKVVPERTAVQIDAAALRITADKYPLLPPNPIDNTAITLSPSERQQQGIDWDRETALAVQSTIANAAKENSYRDLSGPTPEQLDWLKKNHMEPMPSFQWDRKSRRELLRHGIIKLNDYCVLVIVMPFCQFGGKIQYNGDLFKDMRDQPDH